MSELLRTLEIMYGPRLKKTSSAKGGQYNCPCPLCATPADPGNDRFRAYPEQLPQNGRCLEHGIRGTWYCSKCKEGGDMIAWKQKVEGRTFAEACAELGIPLEKQGRAPYKPLRAPRTTQAVAFTFVPNEYLQPPAQWVEHATNLALTSHDRLLHSPNILEWLSRRGLPEEAVRRYKLGYLESENGGKTVFRNRDAWGLPPEKRPDGSPKHSFPIDRGVTIPYWSTDGRALRVRIRRRNADIDKSDPKDPRYRLIKQPGQPFSASLVLPPSNGNLDLATWVITEAELDAMAVHHACRGFVGCISILQATGKPDVRAHQMLQRAACILVATDFDEKKDKSHNPGLEAFEWWSRIYAKAKYWPVPIGKDPGEAYELGVDLLAWVCEGSQLVASAVKNGTAKAGSSRPDSSGLAAGLVRPADHGEHGSLGPKDGCSGGGEGASQPQRQPVGRWPVDTAAADFEAMALPPDISQGEYRAELVRMFTKQRKPGERLIMCPRTKPAWWCVYMEKACKRCNGHPHCLRDVVETEAFKKAIENERARLEAARANTDGGK